jgi:hypothetical protein
MPRRQQRRPAFRPKKTSRDTTVDTAALDAGARRVLMAHGHDADRLAALVRDLQQLRDEADRRAYDEPSPDALRNYRRAAREVAEAERAMDLAAGA